MRFRDKIGPLHDPILKPAILPDFLAVARTKTDYVELAVRTLLIQDGIIQPNKEGA